jgi:hypothetical protein
MDVICKHGPNCYPHHIPFEIGMHQYLASSSQYYLDPAHDKMASCMGEHVLVRSLRFVGLDTRNVFSLQYPSPIKTCSDFFCKGEYVTSQNRGSVESYQLTNPGRSIRKWEKQVCRLSMT